MKPNHFRMVPLTKKNEGPCKKMLNYKYTGEVQHKNELDEISFEISPKFEILGKAPLMWWEIHTYHSQSTKNVSLNADKVWEIFIALLKISRYISE